MTSPNGLELLSPATLAGKTAIVTGSTSGIGLAIAQGLAAAGCNVALSGFGDPASIEAIISRFSGPGAAKARHFAADLSQPAEIRAYVEGAASAFGSVDILVNNVGMQHVEPIDSFPEAQWDKIIALNLSSAFHTTKASVPYMKKAGWGRIINISSAHGLVASPFKSAYVASKHGIVGLTKTVALELAETAITCNAICPGYVNTPLVQGQIADQAKANKMSEAQVVRDVILASQPNKRFIEPAEVAGFALFLCTRAADSITGAILAEDGGWTSR
jgi:3-hydroxybutyrate dehydrogenase